MVTCSLAKTVKDKIIGWVVLAVLVLMVALATAFANRNVYSKRAVDAKIETVQLLHDKDIDRVEEQLDRIEIQTTKLVDHLIEDKQ